MHNRLPNNNKNILILLTKFQVLSIIFLVLKKLNKIKLRKRFLNLLVRSCSCLIIDQRLSIILEHYLFIDKIFLFIILNKQKYIFLVIDDPPVI